MIKDPFGTRPEIENGITIDGEFFSEKKIQEMSFDQIKFLCAFCEEKELRRLRRLTLLERAVVYIDTILSNL